MTAAPQPQNRSNMNTNQIESPATVPRWTQHLLRVAGVYNLVWGAFVVLFPRTPFHWMGIPEPNYPSFVQCLGMVIGVYGIAYWIAADDPVQHWPVVLAGLLGKIFGPIGFVYTAVRGELPWSMGLTLLTNDLAWWIPFTAILIHSARVHEARRAQMGMSIESALKSVDIGSDQSLYELSFRSPLLLVFVRHLGCTFCREALAELAQKQSALQQAGLTPVVISMGSKQQGMAMLDRYGIGDLIHVSDPDRNLFRAVQLPFGTFGQLMGFRTLWRAVVGGPVLRYGFGPLVGHGLQLSGAAVIHHGRLVHAVRHQTSDERTDYDGLLCSVKSITNSVAAS